MRPDRSSTLDESHASCAHASVQTRMGAIINNRTGFTLMELMVTTAIFAILTAIAVPNTIAWRTNAQFNAAVREVKSAVEGARMAAIRTNLQADVIFNGTNVFNTQTRDIVAGAVVPGALVSHQLAPGITVNANNGGQLNFNNRGMPLNGFGGTVRVNHINGRSNDIVVSSVGSSVIQ